LESEPGLEGMLGAIGRGGREEVIGCVKYSIHRTRYFLNWCARCKAAWEGEVCPRGHGRLVMGSRDYLEGMADREEPEMGVAGTPRFRMYVPVREVLSAFKQLGRDSKSIIGVQERLLEKVGNELYVLTKASREEIAEAVGADLAERLVGQRTVDWRERIDIAPEVGAQVELF